MKWAGVTGMTDNRFERWLRRQNERGEQEREEQNERGVQKERAEQKQRGEVKERGKAKKDKVRGKVEIVDDRQMRLQPADHQLQQQQMQQQQLIEQQPQQQQQQQLMQQQMQQQQQQLIQQHPQQQQQQQQMEQDRNEPDSTSFDHFLGKIVHFSINSTNIDHTEIKHIFEPVRILSLAKYKRDKVYLA